MREIERKFDNFYNQVRKPFHLAKHTKINLKGEILIEIVELDRWNDPVRTAVRVEREDIEEGYQLALEDLKYFIEKKKKEMNSFYEGKGENRERRKERNARRDLSAIWNMPVLWPDGTSSDVNGTAGRGTG